MSSDDLEYLRTRAAEERRRAVAAADPNIGQIHADFARQYEAAAAKISTTRALQGSRDAIQRSLNLLAETKPALRHL